MHRRISNRVLWFFCSRFRRRSLSSIKSLAIFNWVRGTTEWVEEMEHTRRSERCWPIDLWLKVVVAMMVVVVRSFIRSFGRSFRYAWGSYVTCQMLLFCASIPTPVCIKNFLRDMSSYQLAFALDAFPPLARLPHLIKRRTNFSWPVPTTSRWSKPSPEKTIGMINRPWIVRTRR